MRFIVVKILQQFLEPLVFPTQQFEILNLFKCLTFSNRFWDNSQIQMLHLHNKTWNKFKIIVISLNCLND